MCEAVVRKMWALMYLFETNKNPIFIPLFDVLHQAKASGEVICGNVIIDQSSSENKDAKDSPTPPALIMSASH